MIATENLKGKSGIYCAIHRDSLMCYVGSSVNLHARRCGHVARAVKGERKSTFQRALSDFGPDAFNFEVLEFCPKEQLLEREEFWILFYKSAGINGFNIYSKPTANYERVVTKATRERISAAHKGRKHTGQALANMQAVRRTKEYSAKTSISHTGHTVSQSTRDKLRAKNASFKMPERARVALEAYRATLNLPQDPESVLRREKRRTKRRLERAEYMKQFVASYNANHQA